MDERTVLPTGRTGDRRRPRRRAPVPPRARDGRRVRSTGDGWWCDPERSAGGNVAAEEWAEADEGDGAAQAFVDLLRYAELPAVPASGWCGSRLRPRPGGARRRGRPRGGCPRTVVVGERVVVAWTRRTVDAPHPGVLTLQHLAAVDFIGVPDVYGVLLWRTPGGHEVPVAVATRYLPRSRPAGSGRRARRGRRGAAPHRRAGGHAARGDRPLRRRAAGPSGSAGGQAAPRARDTVRARCRCPRSAQPTPPGVARDGARGGRGGGPPRARAAGAGGSTPASSAPDRREWTAWPRPRRLAAGAGRSWSSGCTGT